LEILDLEIEPIILHQNKLVYLLIGLKLRVELIKIFLLKLIALYGHGEEMILVN